MKNNLYFFIIIAFFSFNLSSNAQNNALTFSSDYITINSNMGLGTTNVTGECWVNLPSVNESGTFISIGGDQNGYTIGVGDGDFETSGNELILLYDMSRWIATGYTIGTGWHHVAFTVDGVGSARVFLDGRQIHVSGGGPTTPSDFTYIGTSTSAGFRQLTNGIIDEVRIWNIARSEGDIRATMYKELVGNETNLVAYYKFNETSGTTADNAEGTAAYDGTLNGINFADNTVPSSALFGPKNCLNFDGEDDNVWCPNITPTVTSGSIEFWVNLDVIPTDNARLISRGANYSFGDEIYLLNNNGRIYTANFVVGDNLTSTNPLPTDVWTHVAITADGSGSKLYINGIQDDTGGGATWSFNTFRFGGQFTAGFYEGIDGMMDEVRLWNDVRTESEIRENMYKSLVGDEANLVAYFNLDNASGAIAQSYPVQANDGSIGGSPTWVASTAFNTWLNTDDSDWATASNWSNGVPGSTDNVGIYNFTTDPIVSSTADCNDLFIGTGASLTVESGGSLIPAGTQTNNGTFNIEHAMTDGKWHLVSIPVVGATANVFFGDYLQYYNETLGSNNYIDIDDETLALNACQGYAWRNSGKGSFTFTGTPFTGNQSIATTADQANGWNMVGNPYPSSLDWNLLDGTYGTVYTFSDNGVNNGWGTYNDGAVVNNGSRYLAPMQGFFISTASAGSFAVTNADRTHSGATGYVKSEKVLQQFVKLQVNANDKIDETFIQLGDEYEEGFDAIYDGWKMQATDETALQLFSQCTDGQLCIDRRPEAETIPLGFKYGQNTTATISIVEFADLQNIELEDTKLNTFHDLSKGAYQFDWLANDSEERFILHLKATGTEEMEAQDIQVYAADGQVFVRIFEIETYQEITFYDLAGRVVFESNLSNQSFQNFDMGSYSGTLLVQLKGKTKIKTKKVVL